MEMGPKAAVPTGAGRPHPWRPDPNSWYRPHHFPQQARQSFCIRYLLPPEFLHACLSGTRWKDPVSMAMPPRSIAVTAGTAPSDRCCFGFGEIRNSLAFPKHGDDLKMFAIPPWEPEATAFHQVPIQRPDVAAERSREWDQMLYGVAKSDGVSRCSTAHTSC